MVKFYIRRPRTNDSREVEKWEDDVSRQLNYLSNKNSQGTFIIPGIDGEDGEDGRTIPGKDGLSGPPGLMGIPGRDGEDLEENNLSLRMGAHGSLTADEHPQYVLESLLFNVTTVDDTYTILVTDYTVVCNKGFAFTVTCPTAVVGQSFEIKNIGAGTVTVDGAGGDTIDGATTKDVHQWDCMVIKCISANTWIII